MSRDKEVSYRFEQAQNALVLQASDLSLETVANMVGSDAIDIAPLFQRRERWDIARQSALIESFLLNIPVPPVYLSEEEFGRYSVIDGKQRITSIHEYMRNRFSLSHLSRFREVEGMRFKDLPEQLRNALTVRPYIRAITILRQSDRNTKYEVFHRLNTGGQPLNSQEVRNVLYHGPLNDLLVRLSVHPFLRKQLKIKDNRSPAYQNMTDVEYVLRFFTLRNSWMNFTGSFSRSMDAFMAMHQYASDVEIRSFENAFDRSIGASQEIWGNYAFKRSVGHSWRDQVLAAIYDAQMIAIDRLDEPQLDSLLARKEEAVEATKSLFSDPAFDTAVRSSTNTSSRVSYRIESMYHVLRAVAE
ncbi:DUF262 domain-containing protein [Actinosynnema sp. NPDC053489]|uniref:DUF262 domain-containing protein n=1 Tax=Actinosynnema sp. NPDC053489 TaxID=3363916 RepID=UPI0037C8E0EC